MRAWRGDSALVSRCLANDEEAWRELVERHRPAMIAFARRIVAGRAADVVDEVLADLWQRGKLGRYEARSALRTWLCAIVAHAALNARRSDRAGSEAASSWTASWSDVRPAGTERELTAVLLEAIRGLPVRPRVLVQLHYEQGLTLEQAGAILGASKSTLSREMKTARALIRERAERLARERCARSLDALRADADLDRLDLDLRVACGGSDGTN